MEYKFAIVIATFLLVACNGPITSTGLAARTDSNKRTAPQVKYFDHGTVNMSDTAGLKIVHSAKFNITDQSYKYLRQDNYYVDQFSCVVHGYSYYRLTNIHPTSAITGCVTRSWPYNGETLSENIPFSLKPGEWKTFGCFFVTPSQRVTFSICSNFGVQQMCPCN